MEKEKIVIINGVKTKVLLPKGMKLKDFPNEIMEKEFELKEAGQALKSILINVYKLDESEVDTIIDLVVTSDKEFIKIIEEDLLKKYRRASIPIIRLIKNRVGDLG